MPNPAGKCGSILGVVVTPDVAHQVAETNSNIQIALIAGAGHNIRRKQFMVFVRSVKDSQAETKENLSPS